jgi:hypothetical protein
LIVSRRLKFWKSLCERTVSEVCVCRIPNAQILSGATIDKIKTFSTENLIVPSASKNPIIAIASIDNVVTR